MTWTDEQKQKAIPRIMAACESLHRCFDEGNMDTFWFLSGMIRGGLEKYNTPESLLYAADLILAKQDIARIIDTCDRAREFFETL